VCVKERGEGGKVGLWEKDVIRVLLLDAMKEKRNNI